MTADFRLLPTSAQDLTYLARLNFLTDVYGDELAKPSTNFESEYAFYVESWRPENGGFIAWDGLIPAGGVWLTWGSDQLKGLGFISPEIPELAVAVEARYTGQGLATLLLDAATELARQLGAPGVSLAVSVHNQQAHDIYQHLGFEEAKRKDGWVVMVRKF